MTSGWLAALQKQSPLILVGGLVALSIAVATGLISSGSSAILWIAALIGLLSWSKDDHAESSITMSQHWIWIALVAAFVLRAIPYIDNSVPLGYDPGLYKFIYAHPLGEAWIKASYPLPFTLLMAGVSRLLGVQFTLTWLPAILSALTVPIMYSACRKVFGETAAILASLLFSVSVIQFQAFAYNLQKNILGIWLLLFALPLVRRTDNNNWLLILAGALMAGIHTPAFFVFGVTYLLWVILEAARGGIREVRYAIADGALILLLAFAVNFDRIGALLLPRILVAGQSLSALSGSGGFFPGLATFELVLAPLLVFAILAWRSTWRTAKPIVLAAIVCLGMVSLGLFFHNRLVIYLDITLIPLAAAGMAAFVSSRKQFGQWVVAAILLALLVNVAIQAKAIRPLISAEEYRSLQTLDDVVETDAIVLVTDGSYAPWLKGWVERRIIAPGFFDASDRMSEGEWRDFLLGVNRFDYLDQFDAPVYLYLGAQQVPLALESDCFHRLAIQPGQLYEYVCHEIAD